MKNKRAQSSVEFAVLVGFILLFMIIFLFVLNKEMSYNVLQRRDMIISNILTLVQDEINLALKSRDGYLREFQIPYKIDNLNYNINIIEGSVYVITENRKNSGLLPVAPVTGQPIKGANIIKKQNGVVYLNE